MTETKSLMWDEKFPSLLLKGEGTAAFLHGQTTADIFALKQIDRIFLSCWLSTKGCLKALLEIRISNNMAEIVILGGEINSIIHGFELCKEYTHRYNKVHATEKIINDLYDVCKGDYMKKTEPPQCMPDKYKSRSYIQAYRNYYIGDKKRFARYTNRKPPEFMQ